MTETNLVAIYCFPEVSVSFQFHSLRRGFLLSFLVNHNSYFSLHFFMFLCFFGLSKFLSSLYLSRPFVTHVLSLLVPLCRFYLSEHELPHPALWGTGLRGRAALKSAVRYDHSYTPPQIACGDFQFSLFFWGQRLLCSRVLNVVFQD